MRYRRDTQTAGDATALRVFAFAPVARQTAWESSRTVRANLISSPSRAENDETLLALEADAEKVRALDLREHGATRRVERCRDNMRSGGGTSKAP
ncbi:hypothetical protein A0H81_13286 [Grifola frondosa]|uniref:Uncharacterized protein n=1 Tax=Grifola frondosa TaxID=5627 RepID=A0A1C7LV38_GRIFR|nr:hypothetical protein A0H81_13286 [Grifola frondosa]